MLGWRLACQQNEAIRGCRSLSPLYPHHPNQYGFVKRASAFVIWPRWLLLILLPLGRQPPSFAQMPKSIVPPSQFAPLFPALR